MVSHAYDAVGTAVRFDVLPVVWPSIPTHRAILMTSPCTKYFGWEWWYFSMMVACWYFISHLIIPFSFSCCGFGKIIDLWVLSHHRTILYLTSSYHFHFLASNGFLSFLFFAIFGCPCQWWPFIWLYNIRQLLIRLPTYHYIEGPCFHLLAQPGRYTVLKQATSDQHALLQCNSRYETTL